MEKRYEKFTRSAQAAVKLDIALTDWFRKDLPESIRKVYGDYLQLRIRPAAEELIRRDDARHLEALAQWIPDSQLDLLLELAAKEHKNSALVWLLNRKQKTLGFGREDFSL